MGAMGFYLRVGDATTCGGKILTGDETVSWYGVAGAREGDAVSCGKHTGIYKILGGTSVTPWDWPLALVGSTVDNGDVIIDIPFPKGFIISEIEGESIPGLFDKGYCSPCREAD